MIINLQSTCFYHLQDSTESFSHHLVCHVTSGIIRLSLGQEHFFALQSIVGQILVLAQVGSLQYHE